MANQSRQQHPEGIPTLEQEDETLYFGYAARKRWTDADANYLSGILDLGAYPDSWIRTHPETGVCAGIFGLKVSAMEGIFGPWGDHLRGLVEKRIEIGDQIPLNELLLMGRIKGKALPNEWIDYPFTPLMGSRDLRDLETRESFIFHHFNPGTPEMKLQYMKVFSAFGSINGTT